MVQYRGGFQRATAAYQPKNSPIGLSASSVGTALPTPIGPDATISPNSVIAMLLFPPGMPLQAFACIL